MKQTIFKIIKIFSIIAGVIVVLGIAAILVFDNWLGNLEEQVFKESKFDSKKWIEVEKIYNPKPGVYTSDPEYTRLKMYDDLQKNYLKKGMSLDEVIKLLGTTTKRRIYKTKKRKMTCLQYHLGNFAPIGSTSHILLVCPNEKNIIIDFFRSSRADEGQEIIVNQP